MDELIDAEDTKMFEAFERVSKVDKKSISMMAAQLAFKCKRCGRCCKGAMAVMIRPDECRKAAKSLGVSFKNFIKLYTERNRRSEEGFLLKGTSERKPCPFYDETIGCRIYDVRPTVCRLYPCMNIENRQVELHFYTTCPGCVELVEEVYATQLAPGINPVVGELKNSSQYMKLIETIIWSEGMELLEHTDKALQKEISEIRANLRLSRVSEQGREDFRQAFIAYLSLVISPGTLEKLLIQTKET